MEGWCRNCGLNPKDVVAVARELAAAGKRGAVDVHRDVNQHTDGFYDVTAHPGGAGGAAGGGPGKRGQRSASPVGRCTTFHRHRALTVL